MVAAATALTSLSVALAALTTVTTSNAQASTSGALTALKYTNVGGTGSYNQVTNLLAGTWPSCDVSPSCIQTPKQVSGNLAPFDEDMTLVFRGPMNIQNIAVYQPANASASSSWSKTSSWSSGSAADNLVFLNNNGGSTSGTWSVCGGASQSFANPTFNGAAASADASNSQGNVPDGQEINIMTAQDCTASSCDGFYRGVSNLGWADSKMFVVEFDMPTSGSTPPALWALNGQVVRSAQYGCNCRGEGGDGGCGELDILEVIAGADQSQAISEIYSFKGATGTGSGNYFPRPASGTATYAVIFDVKTDQIAIQNWSTFDFSTASVGRSQIDGFLSASAKVVSFGQDKRRSHRPSTFLGAHRRSH